MSGLEPPAPAGPVDPARLSLNTISIAQWALPELIDGCRAAGVGTIGPWRDLVAAHGLEAAARDIRAAGLRVSSLCRGGFFPAADAAGRRARDEDNRAAVDEAAALGTDVLVLVCGPAPDRDLAAARTMVREGIERLAPYAAERGVRLGIEPLHPVMIGERSVIVTLGEAVDLADRFDPAVVGVVIDVYHVWWDPRVYEQIARAEGRILGFHVSDWLVPTDDPLAGRGLMGEGRIELRRLRAAVEAAGYDGPIEVEVINAGLRSRPGRALLDELVERFAAYV